MMFHSNLIWLLVACRPCLHPTLDGWNLTHSLHESGQEGEILEDGCPPLSRKIVLKVDYAVWVGGVSYSIKELEHMDVCPA